MLPTGMTTTLTAYAAGLGAAWVLGAAVPEAPSGILQMSLGGLALILTFRLLYRILKPLLDSQMSANERIVKSIESISKEQSANTEIQRSLLFHATSAASANAALAEGQRDLNERLAVLAAARH